MNHITRIQSIYYKTSVNHNKIKTEQDMKSHSNMKRLHMPVIVCIVLQHLNCLDHNQPSNNRIGCCDSMNNVTGNAFRFKKAMHWNTKRFSSNVCSSSDKLHSQLIIFIKSQVPNILHSTPQMNFKKSTRERNLKVLIIKQEVKTKPFPFS